ncbi:MAG: hypothetical protein ACQXXF_05755 [Thermoplasmatota archaeon]|jgi:hypothetical protein
MKQKLFATTILVSSIIILSSLTSVVSMQTTKTESTTISPLFSSRLTKMINKENKEIKNDYIKKGIILNLFPNKKSDLRGWMDKAIMLIQSNPAIVDSIFNRAEKIPFIMKLLKENGISKNDLTKYATQLKNNPTFIKQEIDQVQINLDASQSPIPKGLGTSNPFACVITVIALLPLVIILALLIGTITIVTCLNIGGCFEALMDNLLDKIMQELIPA